MKQPPVQPDKDTNTQGKPVLPIGQHDGEGSNAVQHEPDPTADPIADGEHRYMPRTGYSHGND
jgi:hypothetical protein